MSSSRFAPMPLPPYYAVVFAAQRNTADAGYAAMADHMMALASTQPGYLGAESARDASGFGITVSYWATQDDIARWKAHAEHQGAQAQGRSTWYSAYALRVARVERAHAHGQLGDLVVAAPSLSSYPSPEAPISLLERSKLANETARHYGNMRFTMFTVFTTITAALLAVPFSQAGAAFMNAASLHRQLLCLAGVLCSVAFFLSQYRVSALLQHYQGLVHAQAVLPPPQGSDEWQHVVKCTMLLPSVLTGLFWTLLWLGAVCLPLA